MITKDNLKDVVNMINDKDKKRILKTDKEFIVLELHVFNVGATIRIKLTNDLYKYKNVGNNGNCILYVDEVINILN